MSKHSEEDSFYGYIYKIYNTMDDKVYIGSSKHSQLSKRMTTHRARARSNLGSKLYSHMSKVGIRKFFIELIRRVKVKNTKELVKLEYKEIKNWKPKQLLNMNTEYGKRCKEHQDKLNKLIGKGTANVLFKRGSIYSCNWGGINGYPNYRVVFAWSDWSSGKRKNRKKSFGIKRFGLEEAMRLAKKSQDEMYPVDDEED